MLHVVMVRVGDRYPIEYVEILSDMLARNLSGRDDVQPWCLTDDPASLPEDIRPIAHDPALPGWWQKVRLFSPDMPWAKGDRVAYFDLDSAIVGRLEDLVERKGIIKDWGWPGFNSSVMVWDHGEHAQIWTDFTPEVMTRESPELAALLPKGQANGGDQEWITQAAPDFPILPEAWCVSYRWSAQDWPPDSAKVVCFHGLPKPHEVTEGWVPNVWKRGGFTQLAKPDGANVSNDVIHANVHANIQRDLPWFTGRDPHKDTAVIVCGGPSLADSIQDIRWRKRQGAKVISVNNTLTYLLSYGITPDAHVMVDARPENAAFLTPMPGIKYFVASQCHPVVFDTLEGHDVTVWHNMAAGMEPIFEPLAEAMMLEKPGAKPLVLVPGGGTVGLRAMALCWLSGYRKLHVYGMDGSYRGDKHHAYHQALNDDDRTVEVQMGQEGRRYRCAPWMVHQAQEFRDAWRFFIDQGVTVFVHGDGLIPDMARLLKAETMQARENAA